MFCQQCGTETQPGYNVCPKCGKVLSWPTAPLAQSRLCRHLRTVGTLWIVVGALWLIPSIILLALGGEPAGHQFVQGPRRAGQARLAL